MEQYINKRIEELQNDSKYSFKQTSEIIELIYKLAISDYQSNYSKEINQVSTKINKNIVNKIIESDELKQSKLKIEQLNETINNLNTKIIELSRQLSNKKDLIQNVQKEFNEKQFQSGLAAGLKYAMMSLEGRNFTEGCSMIMSKYNEIQSKNNK